MKKLGIIFAGLLASKDVLAVAATASVAALVVAPVSGTDPIPWIIGAVCGTLVQAYLPFVVIEKPHPNRIFAYIAGPMRPFVGVGISIVLAGWGQTYILSVAAYILQRLGMADFPIPPNYWTAAIVASTWPLALHYVGVWIDRKWGAK